MILLTPRLAVGAGLTLVACSGTGPNSAARFAFQVPSHAEAVQLAIVDAAARAQAESLVQSGHARWATGVLRRGGGGFNAPWGWHLDPATIVFAEVTAEACQTWPSAVEQDLEYWIAFGRVCFWGTVAPPPT